MPLIKTERWAPSPEDPNKQEYVGQLPAVEVFQALKQHLTNIDYLPEDYFLMDRHWDDGTLFPKEGYFVQKVDYGGNEGIYLDINVHWHDENGDRHIENFATGKTLGESVEDMNRMHLIAASSIVALHGSAGHARYMMVGAAQKSDSLTIHLNGEERALLADNLLEIRAEQKVRGEPYEATERMVRRLVGSITEYMQLVGERPLHMDDFDTCALAIHENNLAVFLDTYPKVPDKLNDLLLLAAAQPGQTGNAMTTYLLMDTKDVPTDTYLQVCKNAIRTDDMDRINLLINGAEPCMAEYSPDIYGKIVESAYSQMGENYFGKRIALELMHKGTPEQLKTVSPYMITLLTSGQNDHIPFMLLRAGVDPTPEVGSILYIAAANHKSWFIRSLIEEHDFDINANGHEAMRRCMKLSNLDAAKMLIDHGADFPDFMERMESVPKDFAKEEFLGSMSRYYDSIQAPTEPEMQL